MFKQLIEEIEEWRTLLNTLSVDYSGMRVDHSPGKPEDRWVMVMEKLDGILQELEDMAEDAEHTCREIIKAVERLSDEREKLMITMRYLNGMNWEEIDRLLENYYSHYSLKKYLNSGIKNLITPTYEVEIRIKS